MAINKNKSSIKPRKIPYYVALTLLTAGASLILGFLSFSGMYAILPFLSLSFATFGLSVAYEGEIYLQNIKGAFKKLFKNNYLENQLAKEYLLNNFPENTDDEQCPEFFKDYEKQRHLLSLFSENPLNKESKIRKRKIEKTLTDMEKWFARQLFAENETQDEEQSAYKRSLRKWLETHAQDEWQTRSKNQQFIFNFVKAFSVLSASFMSLGSTYLIVEAFSVIPVMAAIPFTLWPLMIVPMALISGAAYGVLTYNTITDLISNNTLGKWYSKIRHDLSNDLSARSVIVASMAIFLVCIALALTICTAGTWWTIATNARPLFEWMKKMPSVIMGVFTPGVIGLSITSFNIENIAESMEIVDTVSHSSNVFLLLREALSKELTHIRATENWLQILNPFRLLLKLTVTPLRILFFFGHLISFALTADRMPGVPQSISMLIATISEGFEDAHYFVEDKDIPSRLIHLLAAPLHALAASWDWLTSKLNQTSNTEANSKPKVLTLTQAWNKQRGIKQEEDVSLPSEAKHPSKDWQVEHTVSLIEKHQKKQLSDVWFGSELAEQKKNELRQLQAKAYAITANGNSLRELLISEKNNPIYNRHRLFALHTEEPTSTQAFVDELAERVNAR